MSERGLRYRTPNGTKKITMDSNIDFAGSYDATVTFTGTTAVTFPTSGTLATRSGSETLTNKVLSSPLVSQAAPTAKTVSATLTAAEVAVGLITVNQGAGAASTLTLPLATDMDTQFGNAANTAFDFYVINTSTVDAEDATVATNTGWTLVGNMEVQARSGNTLNTSAKFRARKTATGAWTLYRLS